ncbi:MAG: GNAT family N-acetyltransferase [Anaerolinea sp.]|nr:GNAT family N-acetyltransferase [Anaerolinea sp.]
MTAVRLAEPADAPALARLRFEFRASLNEAVETEEAFLARAVRWMAGRLAAGTNWRCWVAEDGGTIVGHLWLQLIEKIPNPAAELEWHGYITNVFVHPNARGAGAGSALVEAALVFCREKGVDSVILWPTARSRTLYARHGFAVRDDIMEAILDDGRHV